MELKIPDALKADMPQTTLGRLFAATPVVMAVIATLLAGLSSSEMTRAQYDRSLAAQQQSKAGDQWSYFQAKRLRGTGLKTAGDLLRVTAEVRRFDPSELKSSPDGLASRLSRCDDRARDLREVLATAVLTDQATAESLTGQLDSFMNGAARRKQDAEKLTVDLTALLALPDAESALRTLSDGNVPPLEPGPAMDAALVEAIEGVQSGRPEKEMGPLLARVNTYMLEEALHVTQGNTRALDALLGPVNQLSDRLDALLARQLDLAQEPGAIVLPVGMTSPEVDSRLRRAGEEFEAARLALQTESTQLCRDFTAARLRYTAARYDTEARMNQAIANLYELQVRKNNISAERHHTRSQRFFYGMLAAQMGVIVATLAMAARQRNLLWSLAAAAGLAAVSFAVYVFMFV